MDILHLSPNEIRQVDIREYPLLVHYCWMTYTNRRVDYWFEKAFGDGKGSKGKKRTIDWTSLNPAYQALQKKRKMKRVIPKKFLENINKNG